MLFQGVSLLAANDVEVINVVSPGGDGRGDNIADPGQELIILSGDSPPCLCPCGKMRQFDHQNCGLQTVEPAVNAFNEMFAFASMASENGRPIRERPVVGDQASGIAIGTQILAGIEGKRRQLSEGSYQLVAESGQMCLRTIFDHPEFVFAG